MNNILLAIFCLVLVVFCAIFGSLPRLRKTPIGFINRLIWIKVPGLALSVDQALSGGRFSRTLKRSGHYLMNENHPLVLIFYLSIVVGAQCLFLPAAWPRLSTFQRMTTCCLCVLPYIFTFACTFSVASVITPASHGRHMRQYPYDRILFRPGQYCQTCHLLKPARSKHCGICNTCVAKHDHHCIWVMNCLGRANYVYFLAMLLSLAAMLTYGAWLGYLLLDRLLQDSGADRDPAAAVAERWGKGKSLSERFNMWGWAMSRDIWVGCPALLAAFTAPLAAGLLVYHVYLIWAGMTTNESFKWEEWKEDVADGLVYKYAEPPSAGRKGTKGGNQRPGEEEEEEEEEEVEPRVPWPVSSPQRLVSRANKLSMQMELEAGTVLGREPWVQVRSLAEVVNIYDLGFADNVAEVFSMS